jgi:hypothetical protein
MLLRRMLDRPDLAEQVEDIQVHGNHIASTYSNFIFQDDDYLLAKAVVALRMPRAEFFDATSSRNGQRRKREGGRIIFIKILIFII